MKDGEQLAVYLQTLAEMSLKCNIANGSRSVKDGWKFHSMEEFYLKEGHLFSPEPLTSVEKEVLQRMPFSQFEIQMCYMNAALIALEADDDLGLTWRKEEHGKGRQGRKAVKGL